MWIPEVYLEYSRIGDISRQLTRQQRWSCPVRALRGIVCVLRECLACRWKLILMIGSMVKGYESRKVMWFVSSIMICYLDNRPGLGCSGIFTRCRTIIIYQYHQSSICDRLS